MELMFIQPEERHTSNESSHRERANLVALNPNLLAASNQRNRKPKPKGWEQICQSEEGLSCQKRMTCLMATQETHYASMAQLVESSLVLTAIERESKRLQLRRASHARFVPSVWMTNFHCQKLGGAREWLNLIKVTVPAMVSLGPPHLQTDPYALYNYHRDIFSSPRLP